MNTAARTILFVTYGGGHAQMVWPVVDALRKLDDQVDIRVLALPAAKSILSDRGVACFTFADYLDERRDADALEWGTMLAREHHSPSSGIDIRESIAYLGLSYKDLVLRRGEEEAAALLARKGRHAFYPLGIMARIFDDLDPDFVVTTNSPRSEAAAIETANQRGIDNLIMTDLFSGLGDYRLQGKNITFLNRFARDMFLADGLVDAGRSEFHYTGNPAFDRLMSMPREREAGWLRRNFPGADGDQVVLHADTPAYLDPAARCAHQRSTAEILEELEAAHAATVNNGAVYLLRPHPSQEPGFYREWLKGRRNAFLAVENDLHDLLRNISLLLVRTSTVGLEALYLGKRVLQIDSDYHFDLPLARMGVAWGVNSFAGLEDALGKALVDKAGFEQITNRVAEMLPFTPAADKIAGIVLNKLG